VFLEKFSWAAIDIYKKIAPCTYTFVHSGLFQSFLLQNHHPDVLAYQLMLQSRRSVLWTKSLAIDPMSSHLSISCTLDAQYKPEGIQYYMVLTQIWPPSQLALIPEVNKTRCLCITCKLVFSLANQSKSTSRLMTSFVGSTLMMRRQSRRPKITFMTGNGWGQDYLSIQGRK
jgi:hypothetical protein